MLRFHRNFSGELNDRNRIEDIAGLAKPAAPGQNLGLCPSTTRKPPPSVFIQRITPFSALAAIRAGM